MENAASYKLRTPAERVSINTCSRILEQVVEPDKLVKLCHQFIIDPSTDNALSVIDEIGSDTWLLEYLEPPFERWSGVYAADTIPTGSLNKVSGLK
jgi:hypothetical protein